MARKPKPRAWQDEFDLATRICEPLGMIVAWSDHRYEIATIKGDGVQLLIYPHRTSALNYHARVRNNGSTKKARAEWVMKALYHGHGLPQPERDRVRFSCTFHALNRHDIANNGDDIGPMP